MAVSYKRLWKLLIDRDMKKKDLAEKANLSSYTINKMNRGDNVTTDTLVKICTVLNCTFDDIMEMVTDEKSWSLFLLDNTFDTLLIKGLWGD